MLAKRLQLILVVTLALSINILALSASTYAQTAEPASALGQDSVRVLQANWQALPAGAQHWYRFDYAGENLPIRISIDTDAAESAAFQVWTATQFSQLAANPDATPVASSSLDPDNPTHLIWEGTLDAPGAYYIVVQPTTETGTEYLLNIGGRGLAPVADGGAMVSGAPNVNVRSGPSTAYTVVTTVPQGTQLTVLGQDASGNWLSVRLPNGTEGWIARFLTDFTGTASIVAAPSLQPPLAPPATTASEAAIVAGAPNVNVRSGPSTGYAVLRTIPQGAQFTVLGQDTTGAWLNVRFADGTEGWVARYLTNFAGVAPTVAAPLVAPPLAPPATAPLDTDLAAGTTNVNVRSGPSTAYPVIRTVAQGTEVVVLGQDTTGAWLSVQLADGAQGWIFRSLTDFEGTAPVVAAPALTQPPLAPPATAPATVSAVPGIQGLPSQAASPDTFPIEQSLSNNWRTLSGGETHWFTFSHPGDEEPVQIWMNVEPNGAAEFRVFGEEEAQAIMAGANPDDFAAIGRGTANPNEPADLFWRGAFDEHGRYYVMVTSGSTSDVSYSIYGVGPSIGQ
ncbi:MAG TPA: SH3 domain-containing protein [Caldilineaceae bacterium]|nr:SH3 domain-containing protein [Caldilineaceae bacterium]